MTTLLVPCHRQGGLYGHVSLSQVPLHPRLDDAVLGGYCLVENLSGPVSLQLGPGAPAVLYHACYVPLCGRSQ